MNNFKVKVTRRNDPDWPVDNIVKLNAELQKESPVAAAGGDYPLNYEFGPDAWAMEILNKDGECVGGCIFEFWNAHLENCLTVNAVMVLPEYRTPLVTNLLWRELRWYALGCQWIAITNYVGNCTYKTKYRRL